jgi:hypothetical protein
MPAPFPAAAMISRRKVSIASVNGILLLSLTIVYPLFRPEDHWGVHALRAVHLSAATSLNEPATDDHVLCRGSVGMPATALPHRLFMRRRPVSPLVDSKYLARRPGSCRPPGYA